MVWGVAFPRPASAAKCTQQVQSWHGRKHYNHPATIAIIPWAGAVPWLSCPMTSLVSCDWQGPAGSSTAWQERTLSLQYQLSASVLHTARVHGGHGAGVNYRLALTVSIEFPLSFQMASGGKGMELIWYLIRCSLCEQNFPAYYSADEVSPWW